MAEKRLTEQDQNLKLKFTAIYDNKSDILISHGSISQESHDIDWLLELSFKLLKAC